MAHDASSDGWLVEADSESRPEAPAGPLGGWAAKSIEHTAFLWRAPGSDQREPHAAACWDDSRPGAKLRASYTETDLRFVQATSSRSLCTQQTALKNSGKYEESRSTGLRLRKVVLLLRQSLKLTPRRYPASDVKFFPYYRGAADFYTVQSPHRAEGPSRRGAPGCDGSSIGTNDLWYPELSYETTSTQGLREPNKKGPSKSPAKSIAPAAWRASWYSGCRPSFRKTL